MPAQLQCSRSGAWEPGNEATTTFENGVLRNGQQPGSAVNSFIDLGEFGAMKTLSGRIAPRCLSISFVIK